MTPEEIEKLAANFHHPNVKCRVMLSDKFDAFELNFFTKPMVYSQSFIPCEEIDNLSEEQAELHIIGGLQHLKSILNEVEVFLKKGNKE